MQIPRISTTTIGIILLATGMGFGQTLTTEQGFVEAKKFLRQGENTASADYFYRAKAILTRYTSTEHFQALAEYYLGYTDYQLGVVVHRMEKKKAVAYLDSAVEHLEKAIEKDNDSAEAHALLSSCYGIQISFSPLKGIWLGPKSGSEMEKAKELSPENPRVALLGAIGIYNTPALFGGGKEKGLDSLMKAARLFDQWKTPDSLLPDWGKDQVYAWIGLAHIDRRETILARKAFEKALQINPDCGWVKYHLLPKVTSGAGLQ
jgi:tetratricopeptide (TPR) repeat protein